MQSLPKNIICNLAVGLIIACASISNVHVYAQSPHSSLQDQKNAAPANSNEIPDYGGRELIGNIADQSKSNPATPLEQSLRAFQALIIVLCMVFGFLYFVKKFGLLQNNRLFGIPIPMTIASNSENKGIKPINSFIDLFRPQIRIPNTEASGGVLKLIDTCILPGSGGILYVIDIADRNFLVGALGNQISLLSEWSAELVPEEEEIQESEEERFESYLERVGVKEETQPDVISPRVSEIADRLEATRDRVRNSE